ncbi:MAG: 2-hydroxy-3-keto-5-methylthiopentenyl-phosphate phosphatase [Acidobacteriota bacterium]|nr:2-hydroxy-3-keto-5-methylthiopentenyl-phosphate phosphatase [Acidobacteriota bacterium]
MMLEASPRKPILFLDFDGTISERDAIDAILEEFADERWVAVEEEWKSGRIGSRECLARQMEFVRAAPRELDALLASIKLDEGFGALLDACALLNVDVNIVSDGFDYCIRRILTVASDPHVKKLMRGVRACSSHLAHAGGGRWQTEFPYYRSPCAHGCATCKPAVMNLLNPQDAVSVFVGDGLSDRYAAREADLVFAKKSLALFCREQSIAHTVYASLNDVATRLEEIVREPIRMSHEMEERARA